MPLWQTVGIPRGDRTRHDSRLLVVASAKMQETWFAIAAVTLEHKRVGAWIVPRIPRIVSRHDDRSGASRLGRLTRFFIGASQSNRPQ